jgi:hypothetical protein
MTKRVVRPAVAPAPEISCAICVLLAAAYDQEMAGRRTSKTGALACVADERCKFTEDGESAR